jgi:hypothetical protein
MRRLQQPALCGQAGRVGPNRRYWSEYIFEALRLGHEAKEQLEPLVDRSEFVLGHATEYPPDAAFVDGPKVVDERVRRLREAALAWRKRRVERTLAACPGDGHDGDEWERWSEFTAGSLTAMHGRTPRCSWPTVGSSL